MLRTRREVAAAILHVVKSSHEHQCSEHVTLNGIEYYLRSREQVVLLEVLEPANTLLQTRLKELKAHRDQVILDEQEFAPENS